MTKSNVKRLIAAGAIALIALAVYATEQKSGPRVVDHGFNFGSYGENQGIEILNYRYGKSKAPFTHPQDWELANGHISQGGNTNGGMLVGDSLYVKWRVNSTGKVYEDTVDLKSRLPWNMTGKIIHFAIKGSQLYVYLIEGNDSAHLHAKGAPDCPAIEYANIKCTTLYPEHWTNF